MYIISIPANPQLISEHMKGYSGEFAGILIAYSQRYLTILTSNSTHDCAQIEFISVMTTSFLPRLHNNQILLNRAVVPKFNEFQNKF